MQKFLVRSLFLVLLLSVAESWALPPCPGSYDYNTWTNCQGTDAWPDGNKYVGEYKDGARHGQGTYTWPSGSKYVGEYKDGTRHGQGTYTYADGRKYIGEHENGTRHGQGTYTYADGSQYVGEFKDDKQHGQGTRTFPNGDKYVGEYKDDKKHGQGTKTFADGSEKKEGIWEDDEYAHSIVSVTNNLTGNKYRDGDGVLQNHKEALNFYLQSAEEGNKDAMLNIARLYQAEKVTDTLSLTDRISDWWDETDSATSRGRIKTYMWANLAGNDLRDEIAESLTASELEEAQALSSACSKKKYKGC
jgi:hypothetical protein